MASAEEVARYYPLPTDDYLHTELERLQADFQAFQTLIASTQGQGRDCDCFDNDPDPVDDDEPCPIHDNRIQPESNGGDVSDVGLRAALEYLRRRVQAMVNAQEQGDGVCDCADRPGGAAVAGTKTVPTADPAATGTKLTPVNPVETPAVEGTTGVDDPSSLFGSGDDDNDDGEGDTTNITQQGLPPRPGGVDPLEDLFADIAAGLVNPDTSGLGGSDPFDFSAFDVTATGTGDDGDGDGDDDGQGGGDTTTGGGSGTGGDLPRRKVPLEDYVWEDDIYSADA